MGLTDKKVLWNATGVRVAVLFGALFVGAASAHASGISIPQTDMQRLFAGNTSLSVEVVHAAYMSTDPQQRWLAEAYLLGVLDATEGKRWCGYQVASPNAIEEQVYRAVKTASENSPKKRAAAVVVQHFSKLLPCKEGR